ncbi:5-formyltetrahydrofolate cyclo-ligase [Alcanivorax hongdengensis A-11-3]|uniref:5-formyltetrahydrofolate cyclo-ligase n=1 Tax=Alcanivorax hongdengensis A-11-3 TaxID=1177179 RepID=L0WBL5_9GAMM|nr:5-formyltetrahydrofolate cyclo-ligase [Alcanivorax hongdengensis]EKF73130.1 5-formyltetrahydrofolate cyclo-ligase [Alcanivorax hongdengensis A-11-3]
MSDRKTLRRQLRQQRRTLTPGQRRLASRRFVPQLIAALGHRPARHIALYLPADGELDLLPALGHPRLRHSIAYLPWLDPIHRGQLQFRRWYRQRSLRANRYGIQEPAHRYRGRALWALDCILLPAVAFDEQGYRLGMGGGYYDRTLAQLARRPRRPRLLATGYDFQRLGRDALPVAPWDQPVDGIVTDSTWRWR